MILNCTVKKLHFLIFGFLFLICLGSVRAQKSTSVTKSQKGDLYFYWGWNRGFYTNSDMHLYGETYDFTLYNVVGTDRQTAFSADPYLNPIRLTIPQTNFRIGYFFNDHYNISFGFDHMKYVVQTDQQVEISGYIEDTGTIYDGEYRDNTIIIAPDFMAFEHTDGLNYINVELRRQDELFDFNKVKINLTEGVSIGALVPRTDAELLNFEDNDRYHLSGFGFGVVAGLNVTFFDHFFVQTEAKGGFINMPSLRTTPSSTDKGTQSFFFGQYNLVFGWVFHLTSNERE